MKCVRRVSAAMATLLVAVALWVAPATAAQIEVEGDAYAVVESMYLWRGFDLSPESDFVISGGIDLSFNGFTLSYWGNWDQDTNKVNETDLILDYSFDVNDLLSVSVGDVLYVVDELPDTHELYLALSLNTLLSPTLTTYWDWDEADEDGLYYTLSVEHGFAVAEQAELLLGAEVSYNQHSDFAVGDYSAFHNAEFSAAVDYAIHEQIFLTPMIRYSLPLSDEADDIAEIDDETYFGVSVLLAF